MNSTLETVRGIHRRFARPPLSVAIAVALALAVLPANRAFARGDLEAPFSRVATDAVVSAPAPSISAAWGDFDNDGWLDLFLGNQAYPGWTNLLYRNNRDGTFARVASGPVVTETSRSAHAAAWGDYDNDGWLDLVIASFDSSQPSVLYRNTGNGEFTRETAATVGSLATNRAASVAVAWADYDADGFLDLFVANGALVDNHQDALYHNEGNGRFTRILTNAIAAPARRSTQGTWSDYDNDGDPDLLVTHSREQGNSLFRNDGQGRFSDVSALAGLTNSADSVGAAWGDYDGDGDLDLIITNLGQNSPNTRNLLYNNQGNGTFERITTGDVAEDLGHFLSCAWIDYDNDGWLDLFLTVPSDDDPSPTSVKSRLYHNQGDGTFRKVTQGSVVTDGGHTGGAAWGDYDNDGFLDLFVCFGVWAIRTNALYHNHGNPNAWIKIRCVGTDSNRSAIGAKVRVRAKIGGIDRWQLRQIVGSEGWLSYNSPEALIGLGDARVVDILRVEWPSGIVQEFRDVPVRTTLTVVERTSLRVEATSANGIHLHLTGPRQQRYRVDSSANLSDWTPVATLVLTNHDGTAVLPFPAIPGESGRFFRALAEPTPAGSGR